MESVKHSEMSKVMDARTFYNLEEFMDESRHHTRQITDLKHAARSISNNYDDLTELGDLEREIDDYADEYDNLLYEYDKLLKAYEEVKDIVEELFCTSTGETYNVEKIEKYKKLKLKKFVSNLDK